jgi:hypothetical protein
VSGTGNDTNPCSRTSPCLTFAGALSKTAAGGEIDCLDAGSFGTVTINKAITIDCAGGGGGITIPNGGNGINVAAGATDKVVIRNMLIQGPFGNNGVRVTAGDRVMLDNVRIAAFPGCGVCVNKSGGGSLHLRNTLMTNLTRGIQIFNSSSEFKLQVDRSRIDRLTSHGVELGSANMNGSITEFGDRRGGRHRAAGECCRLHQCRQQRHRRQRHRRERHGPRRQHPDLEQRVPRITAPPLPFSGGGTVSSNNTNTVVGPAGLTPNGGPIPFF